MFWNLFNHALGRLQYSELQ